MASAEEWAHSAAQAAQRSALAARETANAALKLEQGLGRVEREMRETRSAVTVGLTALRDRMGAVELAVRGSPRAKLASLTHEDFEDTENGQRKIISRDTFDLLMDEHRLHQDGHKWRRLWRRARGFVWTVAGAAGALGAEQLITWIARHL